MTQWKAKILEPLAALRGKLPNFKSRAAGGPAIKKAANRHNGVQSGTGTAVPENFSAKIRMVFLERIDLLSNRLLDRFPKNKRRPILLGLGGLVVLFFVLVIALVAVHSGQYKERSVPDLASGPYIPMDDLFIPSEPDFLPEFLLERESRQYWSIEDIRPYWKNPSDPALWREEIKPIIDELMEGVP